MDQDDQDKNEKVRAKNRTYYKEYINKKTEGKFIKSSKDYYKSLLDITQEWKILYLGLSKYDLYEFGNKQTYKQMPNWTTFPEDSQFGHVSLENKRLYWFGAMNYKWKYDYHIEVNGYPYIDNYDEVKYKLKNKSYQNYIKPLLIDIDENLTNIKLNVIYSKYEERLEPKMAEYSHHPLVLNSKRKRNEIYQRNYNYKENKTNSSKISFNQLRSIQYNDFTKIKAETLSKNIGVKYSTVRYYKHMFDYKKFDAYDYFNQFKKKTKVIPEITQEIEEVISELYPWNGRKEVKKTFDIRYPLNQMSQSWYQKYYVDHKFSYNRRRTIKSHSNSADVKFQPMNCAFKLLDWIARSKHLIYFDESYIDSNIAKRYSYTKTFRVNYFQKDYNKKRYNILYSVSDIGKLPFMASANNTNSWTVLHYMQSVCEYIQNETSVRLQDCMWVVDDCNIHVAKFIIKEITEKWKMSLTILPIGSSCIMASEYVFHILKDIVLPSKKIDKSKFEVSTIDEIKQFSRSYELASMRLSYNNLLLSLDFNDLY